MPEVWALLATSSQSVGRVLGICALGVVLVRYPRGEPLLSRPMLAPLSRLAYFVLNPALTVVKLSALSTDDMASLWMALCWSVIQSGIAYIAASAVASLLRVSPKYSPVRDAPASPRGRCRRDDALTYPAALADARPQVLTVACVFSNALAFPALVAAQVCQERPTIHSSGASASCYDASMAALFIYNIPWKLALFSAGNALLARAARPAAPAEKAAEGGAQATSVLSGIAAMFWNLPVMAVLLGASAAWARQSPDRTPTPTPHQDCCSRPFRA